MQNPRKASLRWHGFNYASTRTYYVTICVHQRLCRLGRVLDGAVELSPVGEMVQRLWARIPEVFPTVILGEFVIMPNHIHGLIRFTPAPDAVGGCAPQHLGRIVGWWKSRTTAAYAAGVASGAWPRFERRLWQRGYFDRVIRDEDEHMRAEGYIRRNPRAWEEDPHNPERRA